jgi:hypothetical protein
MRHIILTMLLVLSFNLGAQDCSKFIAKSLSVPANCYGGDGKILLTKVEGGKLPYTYQWSNGFNEQNLLKAKAGVYLVVVKDAKGCVISVLDSILQPAQIVLDTKFTPILCSGGSSTIINLVQGGKSPYTFLYLDRDNKPIDINKTLITAGAYRVRVTDSRGCTMETKGFHYVVDTIPPIVVTESVKSAATNVAKNGSIKIDIVGGRSPYKIKWNTGDTIQSLENLRSGMYDITITDKNGCTHTKSIYVDYLRTIKVKEDKKYIEIEPKLGQNYPNPFYNFTMIEYLIPKKSDSRLELQSMESPNMLKAFKLDPEKNVFILQKDNLRSGFYIYRLIVDGKIIDTKRILIERTWEEN